MRRRPGAVCVVAGARLRVVFVYDPKANAAMPASLSERGPRIGSIPPRTGDILPHKMTVILRVNSLAPEPGALRTAGDILRAGGLVAFPTDRTSTRLNSSHVLLSYAI